MTRPSNPTPSQEPDPASAPGTSDVDASEQDPSRTRRIWPWLIVLPLIAVALALLTFNWRAAARLQTALDDLSARGEPITYAEAYALLAAYPPADNDNLASVPLLLAMHDSEPGRAMRRQLEDDQPELLERWQQLESQWGRNAETKASSIQRTSEDFDAWHPDNPMTGPADPDRDWPWIEHDDGPAASIYLMSEFLHPLIHQLATDCRHRSRALWSQAEIAEEELLSARMDQFGPEPNGLVGRVQALRAIALAALEREDPELAVAAIELSLALVRAQGESQAMIIGIVVTTAMAGNADGPLYAGLNQQAWIDAQLVRLQQAIEYSLGALVPESSLRMERVFSLTSMQMIKRQRNLENVLLQFLELNGWQSMKFKLLPDGTFDKMAIRVIESYDRDWLQPGALLPQEVHHPESNRPEWLSWVEALSVSEFLDDLLISDEILHRVTVRARAAETRLRLAHAAIALERFFLQHERYPADWQELIPAFLEQAPLDPFTRGELVLRSADPAVDRERPVIYSLGLNREDNGGNQAFNPDKPAEPGDNFATGDVVWGYPGDEPSAAGPETD